MLTQYKTSLRARVIVAFALSGALIGSLFAVAAYIVGAFIEIHFIEDTVGEELRQYIAQIEEDPDAMLAFSRMRGYVISPGDEDRLPTYLAGLKSGIHERYSEGHEYHVAVQDQGGKRFYLVYDATHIENWEALLHGFLVVSVLGITCLAFCLGHWLSARVLAPVTRLAEEVRQLHDDPNATHRITNYGNDEVGDLARAFDQLIQRLWAFAKREAEFTADVSHELRTPIAVVRTTAELLLYQTQVDERLRPPLRRLDRAGRQMSNLIDVFLMLARESQPSGEETAHAWPLESVIREILDARKEDLGRKGLAVEVKVNGDPEARVPRAVLTVIFGNLVGNAIAHTRKGRVRITLDEQHAVVEDTGAGISEKDEPHVFQRAYRGRQPIKRGSGLGLAIVHRLCQRYGWHVEIESAKGHGTRVSLEFSP